MKNRHYFLKPTFFKIDIWKSSFNKNLNVGTWAQYSKIATGNIILVYNICQTQKETNLSVLSFFYVSLLTRQEAYKNWFFSSCKAYNVIFIVPLRLLTAFGK